MFGASSMTRIRHSPNKARLVQLIIRASPRINNRFRIFTASIPSSSARRSRDSSAGNINGHQVNRCITIRGDPTSPWISFHESPDMSPSFRAPKHPPGHLPEDRSSRPILCTNNDPGFSRKSTKTVAVKPRCAQTDFSDEFPAGPGILIRRRLNGHLRSVIIAPKVQ